ncbi:MAG: N-acetylmuramoyl-L-alanine amidase [Opitutaceae bacterium]
MTRARLGRWLIGSLLVLGLGLKSIPLQAERLYDTEYDSIESLARAAGLAVAWPVPQKKAVLTGRSWRLAFEADSRDFDLDGLRVFLGEPAVPNRRSIYISRIDRERFLLPILNPAAIPGPVPRLRTIVIDPGHGGKDDGTVNAKLKLREKAMTLDVALRLEKLLKAAGYQVVLTRRKDTFVPLPLRPAYANKVKADLFISIHFNAIDSNAITGSETYILTKQGQRSTSSDKRQPDDHQRYAGNADDPWNAVLGYRIHHAVVESLQSFDRGLKHARFAVLRDLDCPGLLIEAGYLSNEAEARRIGTADWRQKLAQAIAGGVADYRAALGAGRK